MGIGAAFVGKAEDVVGAGLVVLGEDDGGPGGKLVDAFFIAAVDFALAAKDIGDLLLGEVGVNAQIFQTLKKHGNTSFLQRNATILLHER